MSRHGSLAAVTLILALGGVPASPCLARDDVPRLDQPSLPGLDRAPLTEADLEHGTTLLVVWATWSPRCRGVAARIDRLAEVWGGAARVASVVFQEDAESIRETVGRSGLDAAVYLDLSGDFSRRHAVTTLPMLLIFRDGELAFRGKLAASPDAVIERILE